MKDGWGADNTTQRRASVECTAGAPRLADREPLGASAAAECHVTDLVEEHRPLQRIQLRDVRRNLREERIAQKRRSSLRGGGCANREAGPQMSISSAAARRASEDSVGIALPFSILEM